MSAITSIKKQLGALLQRQGRKKIPSRQGRKLLFPFQLLTKRCVFDGLAVLSLPAFASVGTRYKNWTHQEDFDRLLSAPRALLCRCMSNPEHAMTDGGPERPPSPGAVGDLTGLLTFSDRELMDVLDLMAGAQGPDESAPRLPAVLGLSG